MTGFFEIFNPGQRYWREQQDYDKIAVVPTKKGGRGPLQIDLDGGTVVVPTDGGAARVVGPTPDAAPTEPEGPTASAAAQFGAGSGSTTVSIPVRKSGAKAPVDATSERGSAARIPGGEPSADRTQPSQDSAESA